MIDRQQRKRIRLITTTAVTIRATVRNYYTVNRCQQGSWAIRWLPGTELHLRHNNGIPLIQRNI